MNTYPDLYRFAGELEVAWAENEGVEWQEAEDLVRQIEKMAEDDRGDLQAILDYAEAEDEWDCDEVSTWPQRVLSTLENSEKDYRYRPAGDEWEVVGVYMSGNEDWVATVDTETVAERLVAVSLQGPAQGATMASMASVEWAASRIEKHAGYIKTKNDSVLAAANYAEECLAETGMHLHRTAVEIALRERAGLI